MDVNTGESFATYSSEGYPLASAEQIAVLGGFAKNLSHLALEFNGEQFGDVHISNDGLCAVYAVRDKRLHSVRHETLIYDDLDGAPTVALRNQHPVDEEISSHEAVAVTHIFPLVPGRRTIVTREQGFLNASGNLDNVTDYVRLPQGYFKAGTCLSMSREMYGMQCLLQTERLRRVEPVSADTSRSGWWLGRLCRGLFVR